MGADHFPVHRRSFLIGAAALAAAPTLPRQLFAAVPAGQKVHGLSAFGELKYPADFKHFDWVNPDAPKGGRMNFSVPSWLYNQSPLTFNTLNAFVLKGEAPPRTEMCFDSLMTRSLDEPDACYGLLADGVTISDDRNIFEFSMRPEAHWHDGTPLTAEDAAFSYSLLKEKGHPDFALPLAELKDAVATDARTLRLTFSGNQAEMLVLTVVSMPILSKAYYAANKDRMLRLSAYSRQCLHALQTDTGIQFEGRRQGTLQLFRTQKQMDDAQRDVQALSDAGIAHELVDGDRLAQYEPALAQVRHKLVGGLRYDDFSASYRNPAGTISNKISDSLVSPRVGLIFQPDELTSYYVSYGTSYNTSGDTYQFGNLGATTNRAANTPPEKSRNIEIGSKFELFERRALLGVAMFYSEKYNERNTDPDTAAPDATAAPISPLPFLLVLLVAVLATDRKSVV